MLVPTHSVVMLIAARTAALVHSRRRGRIYKGIISMQHPRRSAMRISVRPSSIFAKQDWATWRSALSVPLVSAVLEMTAATDVDQGRTLLRDVVELLRIPRQAVMPVGLKLSNSRDTIAIIRTGRNRAGAKAVILSPHPSASPIPARIRPVVPSEGVMPPIPVSRNSAVRCNVSPVKWKRSETP